MISSQTIQPEQITIEPETGERPVIKVEPPQIEYEKKKNIVKNKRIIWYIWMVLEASLLIRFILKLFGANPESIFSILITIVTFPFTIIFMGLFPSSTSITGNLVIEWSTLFAMLVYALIAFLISQFYRIKKPIDPKEAEDKAEQTIP